MDTKGARALAERLEEARLREELRQEHEAEVAALAELQSLGSAEQAPSDADDDANRPSAA